MHKKTFITMNHLIVIDVLPHIILLIEIHTPTKHLLIKIKLIIKLNVIDKIHNRNLVKYLNKLMYVSRSLPRHTPIILTFKV